MAQNTLESWAVANGKKGDCFYSDKPDRHITALATYYKKKVITERLITVTTGGKEPKSKYITKVTLI